MPGPILALLCDRDDLTGEFRRLELDHGKPLAGKITLNRLELTPVERPQGQYKKIVADPAGMDDLLVEAFLKAQPEPPAEVILTWTPRSMRCTVNRRGDSSTATTSATVTCP